MINRNKKNINKQGVTEIFFGMYSDGKEGGSDGKEGCRDGGHCNRFNFLENESILSPVDYKF
jgi:hypothetical protein